MGMNLCRACQAFKPRLEESVGTAVPSADKCKPVGLLVEGYVDSSHGHSLTVSV